MNPLDRELELTTRAILAAEDWARGFNKAPKQHAELIKNAAKMQRQVLTFLRDLSQEVPQFIDWFAYSRAVIEQQRALKAAAGNVQAYDVNVIVNQDALDQQDQTFIKVVFDTVATGAALGAESLQVEVGAPIGLSSTSTIIQNLTTDQLANLVGMKVDKKTGLITPNPNPKYNITETTRKRIASSIKNSIQLGKNQQQAREALQKIIADPQRADDIAHTEMVRAYAEGRAAYANESGATGKYWEDRAAVDICSDNSSQGIIPLGENFISGDEFEPAHNRCKCITGYVYGSDYSTGDRPDELLVE